MESTRLRLLDLPSYVIEYIISYLPGPNIAVLEQTCKSFQNICSQDFIWKDICIKEYNIVSLPEFIEDLGVKSYKELYTNVLYKYQCLFLGVFKLSMSTWPYGGLMHIRVDQDCLLIEELCPPRNYGINESIRRVPWFKIRLSDTQKFNVECMMPYNKGIKHKALLTMSQDSLGTTKSNTNNKIVFNCLNCNIHCSEQIGSQHIIKDFGSKRLGEREVWALWMHKYQIFTRLLEEGLVLIPFQCHQLQEDHISTYNNLIFPSGVFKGTYCPHGIELVQVKVCDQNVTGVKLTGDPHIPADKITFKIDLTIPCQFEIDSIEGNQEHIEMYNFNRYKFDIPYGYQCLYTHFPQYYEKCFKGKLQIAALGYRNPK